MKYQDTFNSYEFHKTLHKFRMLIQSLPIKRTDYRWRICERNQNIGWNECRLEMLKQIGEIMKANKIEMLKEELERIKGLWNGVDDNGLEEKILELEGELEELGEKI